jgi:DegV family protein with EDD domain
MPVMVGEEIYGEGEDDITETIALALAAGKSVKTSRPSPGQFEQAFLAAERGGYESVVSIHISGGLSGTADAARLAAARVNIPVEVVDSGTVGMALGMGVQSAVTAAAAGLESAAVSAAATDQMARTRVYFYVPSLEQLRRGGRMGAAASLLGTMFAIKPILAVDGGKIVPLEKVRSAAKAIARLEEIAAADAASRPAGRARLAVHHFGNPAEAEGLAARLAAALPGCPPAQISSLPAVLAAHAGLGVLAVIVGESAPPLMESPLST